MSDQARLFLAVILSMGAIYFYNTIFVTPKIEAAKKARLEAQKNESSGIAIEYDDSTGEGSGVTSGASEGGSVVSAGDAIKNLIKRSELISQQVASRVKIDSDKVFGSINLQGAKFDDIALKNHREELNPDSDNVVLLYPQKTKKVYFVRTGFLPTLSGLAVPDANTIWTIKEGSVLKEGQPIVLEWDSGNGVVYEKRISIDSDYMITVKEVVINNSPYPVGVAPFGLINQTHDMDIQDMFISHEGPIAVVDNILEEISYDDLIDEKKIKFKQHSGWAGITSKYWMSAVVPQNSATDKFDIGFKYYEQNKQIRFQADILGDAIQVAPNSQMEYDFNLYAGAKNLNILDRYESEKNIPLFDHSIDFGVLYFLTRPMFEALTYFNGIIGNFGLAILLLTVCIRLILFPIANKSYNSMARMRKHMPEIQNLKKRHEKDRQKLGQEMMKYYRDHKINPASGCLPMFIQIPVFFSLYKVLYVTIEMRHAPFYGWITDLSVSDPTNVFNLFGLLPFTPPSFVPVIGVLPLLFSLTMVFQQKLNPPATDETQRMVMAWLPWIFLFVFAGFPAGLVLYWVWNNILSIAQQYIITKRIEEDKNA